MSSLRTFSTKNQSLLNVKKTGPTKHIPLPICSPQLLLQCQQPAEAKHIIIRVKTLATFSHKLNRHEAQYMIGGVILITNFPQISENIG